MACTSTTPRPPHPAKPGGPNGRRRRRPGAPVQATAREPVPHAVATQQGIVELRKDLSTAV